VIPHIDKESDRLTRLRKKKNNHLLFSKGLFESPGLAHQYLSPDSGQLFQARESSKLIREFKNRHRGDFNRSRLINVKQRESNAKVHPPDGRAGRLRKEHCAVAPETSSFYWTWG
jgi:hypothetical protein